MARGSPTGGGGSRCADRCAAAADRGARGADGMRYLFDQVQMSHGSQLAVRGTFSKGVGRRGAACCTG